MAYRRKIQKELKQGSSKRRTTRKRKKLIETKYYVVYVGPHKHISLSGVGRIITGKKYLISRSMADTLRLADHWEVSEESVYEEINS